MSENGCPSPGTNSSLSDPHQSPDRANGGHSATRPTSPSPRPRIAHADAFHPFAQTEGERSIESSLTNLNVIHEIKTLP
jgi:hypothetical protein